MALHTHQSKQVCKMLNKVYLPGLFLLSYDFKPIVEQKFIKFEQLDKSKTYFPYSNGEWTAWILRYYNHTWMEVGLANISLWYHKSQSNYLYTTIPPKNLLEGSLEKERLGNYYKLGILT